MEVPKHGEGPILGHLYEGSFFESNLTAPGFWKQPSSPRVSLTADILDRTFNGGEAGARCAGGSVVLHEPVGWERRVHVAGFAAATPRGPNVS